MKKEKEEYYCCDWTMIHSSFDFCKVRLSEKKSLGMNFRFSKESSYKWGYYWSCEKAVSHRKDLSCYFVILAYLSGYTFCTALIIYIIINKQNLFKFKFWNNCLILYNLIKLIYSFYQFHRFFEQTFNKIKC